MSSDELAGNVVAAESVYRALTVLAESLRAKDATLTERRAIQTKLDTAWWLLEEARLLLQKYRLEQGC